MLNTDIHLAYEIDVSKSKGTTTCAIPETEKNPVCKQAKSWSLVENFAKVIFQHRNSSQNQTGVFSGSNCFLGFLQVCLRQNVSAWLQQPRGG